MLRDYVEKVLIEYNDVRNKENFSDNPLAKVLRNEFPNYLKEITDNPENYKFDGSAGQGNWTYSPWVAVFNKKITESAQKGYYIVYLFRENMKGVYLSLNQGMTNIKKQTSNNSQTKDLLSSRAEDFRNQLKDSISGELLEEIDLEVENSPNAPFYEAGNIYAKYYSIDNLPSEESLESDFKEFLRLYELLVDERDILEIIENSQEIKEAQDKFLEIMYNYADEVIPTEKFDLGPKMRVEVHWSNKLGIYFINRVLEDPSNRYMNAFGIQKPDVNINLPVVCEINIPKDGINKNVQGAFAKDLEENVYLIHRGNIGGKPPKVEFFDKYNGETAQIQDGNTVTDVILIGYLNPKLPEKVKNFVFQVAKIKDLNNEDIKKPIPAIKPWISNFLDNIFKSYLGAKSKGTPVVGSKISLIFINFKHELKEFANNLPNADNFNEYETYSVNSGRGKWVKNPNVYIYDVNLKKNDKYNSYPYLVSYNFSKDIQEVYLSLRMNWGYASLFLSDTKGEYTEEMWNDYFKSETTNARDKLINLGKISSESNWAIPKDEYSHSIFFKCYQKNNLPEEKVLQADLSEIINLYQDLIHGESNIGLAIIKRLFEDFKDEFLDVKVGKDHLLLYDQYSKNVQKIFNSIENHPEVVNDISDPIINYLLPIKGNPIAPAAVGDIKAYGYTDEDLPSLTKTVFKLLEDLINSNDKIYQKDLIKEFKNGPYSKGFQTAMLSPVLYCLDNKYWLYNNKTVNTFNLLSGILDEDDKIDGFLDNYIDNLDKLSKMVDYISVVVPEFSDFKIFDAFCHWMCDKNLGYYAMDQTKYAEWLKINFPEEPKIDNTPGTFAEFLVDKGYYFEPEMIENFLLSLKVKPFVILSGNSGTGKTKIAQLFSKYIALKNGECHKIVPVGANWTENRHIIGFYNVITNKYITSEALELILEASKPGNKDKPFFLILDEMNLSHVERYFADFLSAMESDEYISLHKSNDKIGYPNDIKIPKNLFVIGTVNVDETTYMFSPKVLDRANVIEFSTISAKDYMLNGVTQDQLTGNVNYLENPLYEHNLVKSLSESRIENFRSYLENVETLEGNKLWDLLSDELNIFQEVLKTAGFDFGFRVIDEILRFMYVAWYYEGENEIWDNWQRYFDAQIKQKMLPRIHGSQRVLENTLNELSQLCVDYPTSKAKIEEMKDVLYKQRYVSFTN